MPLKFRKSIHDIYIESLKQGIIPYRYIRNLQSISVKEQLKLAQSQVSVIGAGGLGGPGVNTPCQALGIGKLVVVDHDVFDETNLNRQALSSTDVIGESKARTAASVIASINPAVNVLSWRF